MKFCGYCGKQLADNAVCDCEEAKKAQAAKQKPANKKTARKPILLAAIVAIVVIVAVILLVRSPKADPMEYLDVTFSGLSGQGKCVVDLDKDKMIDIILDVDADDIDDLDDLAIYFERYEVLDEEITVIASKETGLSNGDVVDVSVMCTGEAARHFKSVTVTKTVEGLTEAIMVDPFEDLEITYSGINGSGEITVINNKNDDVMQWVTFVADPQNNLSSGDEVVITANLPESTSLETGYYLSTTTKTVTVPELGGYLTDPADIPESLIQEILDYYIPKYTWTSTETRIYDTPQHYGSYFLVYDEPGWFTPYNQLVVWIYFENELTDGTQMPTEYISITYNNLVINSDSTIAFNIEDGYDYDAVWPVDIDYEISSLKNTNNGTCYELSY